VKDLPLYERPRERLISLGEGALSSVELIAIILGEGTKGKSALELAAEIVAHFKGIEALFSATIEELIEFNGLGIAKAVRLKAALSLSLKLQSLPKIKTKALGSEPEEIFLYVQEDFLGKDVEMLMMVHLDSRGHPFQKEIIGIGTLNALLVDPKEIFYRAIKRRSNQFILVHNHPSGDVLPSDDDIRVSKKIYQISTLMQCLMKDHIIVSNEKYFSIRHLFL